MYLNTLMKPGTLCMAFIFLFVTQAASQELEEQVTVMKLDQALTSQGRLGGVTVDRLGYVYVANFGESVWKISPQGKVKLLTDGLYGSSGNAIDKNGDLYQANFYANSIIKIDRFGEISTVADQGLNGPVGLAFDKEGSLLVCNCSGNYLSKVSSKGEVSKFASSNMFNCPNGLAINDNGDIMVVNFGNDQVVKVDGKTGTAKVFAKIPVGEGLAHIVAYNNGFFVTKIKTNTVYRLAPTGEHKLIAGTGTSEIVEGPASEASFSRPNGLAFDPGTGTLYVNNLNGEWQGNKPSTIEITKIKIVTLTDLLLDKINKGSIEDAEKAFWGYKKDPMHKHEDVGLEMGTLGWRLMSQRKVKEAIAVFTLMREAYPDRWRPWYYLGEIQKIIGQPKEAMKYYKESLKRDPKNAVILEKLKELERK